MAILKPIALATLALAAHSTAQSTNPGVGSNPKATGATEDVTSTTGPNGSEDWLNTGITGDGWNPPFLSIDDVYHVSLDNFYNGIGSACKQYDGYFQSAGSKYSVDPVILAVIAMQESSCNANAGGPTPGLMQVSCENYPNGQCTDSIQDNVDAGTHYLASQLDASGGNAIKAFGSYNGWFTKGSGLNGNKGLTQDYPCSAEGKSNGVPQNLDYLHQVMNGWLMGLDVYGADNWIGTYKCDQSCDNGSLC
ncbi:hypothetical protein N7499_002535 [Penicillium canescens]|uniref:Transglycosylase SLT domain-containing protein n=1 Tax=Penicillium canescens TaxID=5083 RepID=A0AAD6N6S1_PENCN|nr:uncharacterized protein N7446_010137 [Penicillium canescens]KAJ6001562.1 hypothetical protein N7522_006789 [Penicillium canescens]KAJ6035378.1 hypothetical protein N7460_009553 [Penicillium canescens]KAJ6037505.1 hypothetical protein N7444_010210 [Penicillium canescens]KAJ6054125.1 hypothetical protein N7446_010137 [Penicillium canescens]KAJ6098161.1 hypothetical protein N7499_002535 [Penicillium canescens]